MKNLLNNAVEELVVRGYKELDELRNDIKIEKDMCMKLNILNDRRDYILRLLDKLDYLKEQMKIRFPEEELAVNKIDRYNLIVNVQLEDILNIINEAGYEIFA